MISVVAITRVLSYTTAEVWKRSGDEGEEGEPIIENQFKFMSGPSTKKSFIV